MTDPFTAVGTRRIILALRLGGLLVLAYAVLQLFLVPVAWAAIMAHITWPLHLWIKRMLGGRSTPSAVLMTLLLTATFVLPLLWLVAMLRTELVGAYAAVAAYLAQVRRPLPDFVAAIPWLGDWVEQRTGELLDLLGGVGRNAAKLGFAPVTVLFLYRDGETLLAQLRQVLRRFVGARIEGYRDEPQL